MKNIDNVVLLTQEELEGINGGILPIVLAACAVSIAATSFGYSLGKDLCHIVN